MELPKGARMEGGKIVSDSGKYEWDGSTWVPRPETPQGPLSLQDTLKSGVQSALTASDKFLSGARGAVSRYQQADQMGPLGRTLADILNPIPGDTAQALTMAATAPIKGSIVTGPLKRALAAGLTGAAVKGIQGEDPLATGLRYGGSQLAAEVPFAAIQGVMNQRALGKALKNQRAKSAFDEEFTKALTGVEQGKFKGQQAQYQQQATGAKEQFRQQTQKYKADVKAQELGQKTALLDAQRKQAQEQAKTVAAHYKQNVPAWRDIPGDETGLVEMVYGRGPQKLSANFDAAIRAAKESSKGIQIQLSLDDAAALGIIKDVPKEMLGFPGKLPFDAPEVIDNMIGKWAKSRQAYRHAADALEAAGVGTAAARAEYKSGMSLIDFAEKTGMLESYQFRPDRVAKGLTTTPGKIKAIRGRGEGTALEGPLAQAGMAPPPQIPPPSPLTPPTLNLPQRPQAPATRITPPAPELPEGFKVRTVPDVLKRHPWASAGLMVGAPMAAMGLGKPMGAVPLEAAILGLHAMGGKPFAMQAPMSPLQELAQRLGWTLGGAGIRGTVEQEREP